MSGSGVPALMQRHLDRALPRGGLVPRWVRLRQVGQMWLKPGGRPLRFSAVEELAVEEVASSWRARVGIVPGISLRVVDRYSAGVGCSTCVFSASCRWCAHAARKSPWARP